MTISSVREQAKEALLGGARAKRALDTIADTYIDDPSPTLEQTIRIAESFGAIVSVIVEFPETQPLQQD